MIVFTIPLLLLYELGVAGSFVVARRKRLRDASIGAMVLLALGLAPARAHAQGTPPPVPTQGAPPGQGGRGRPGQITGRPDTLTLKRLGLPTAPRRTFPAPDSVYQAVLARDGFAFTQVVGDSSEFRPDSFAVALHGHAAMLHDSTYFDADALTFDNAACQLLGTGDPQMFQGGKPIIGRISKINTCTGRLVVTDAFTSFNELGGDWFMRGNFAVDSNVKRLYASNAEFTTCDLPEPDYHFTASEVKWVSQSVIVARPAVLYVRDVPVVWMPFIFQDTKEGRRSGILIPKFGFNDIVRPTRDFNRSISNLGYYWAPNDYLDVTGTLDWYANRYTQYGARVRYAWLDRFITGEAGYSRQIQSDGSASMRLMLNHSQKFNNTTSLALNLDYATNTRVVQGNAIDPLQNTASIRSSANFTKTLPWAQLSFGGTRSQTLSDGSTTTTANVALQPHDLAITSGITWSPSFTLDNTVLSNQPATAQILFGLGAIDSLLQKGHSRQTTLSIPSPIRIGTFTWNNSFRFTDQTSAARVTRVTRIPDSTTADPNDSVNVQVTRNGDFRSALFFDTGINLPLLFRSSWKITPTVGVTDILANYGTFYRSPATNGNWIQQGKKLQFGLSAAPNFYFFTQGGIGPAARLRYSLSPIITWRYSPRAKLSEEFARAVTLDGLTTPTATPATMTASIALSEDIQAKPRRAATDTSANAPDVRPVSLVSISTSAIAYDFEQAKLQGRTGWTTPSITNTFTSAFVPGFNLAITHDLWRGQVGYDTAQFSPFLSGVQASVQLSGRTFRGIAALFGLAHSTPTRPAAPPPGTPVGGTLAGASTLPGFFRQSNLPPALTSRGFSMNVNFTLNRRRPGAATLPAIDPTDPFGQPPIVIPTINNNQSNIGLDLAFSPTRLWTVSWNTQYNATASRFESQRIVLQRDLHDWRASFNFVKNANQNFELQFSIYLLRLTDIKFDYRQSSIQP